MFNDQAFEKQYLLTADETFVECMKIHQDISSFELVLQKHGISTFHEMSILYEENLFFVRWLERKGMFRLCMSRYSAGSLREARSEDDCVPVNECPNSTKKFVHEKLTEFLTGLVAKLPKLETKEEGK